ncbi:MAG: hypothetical protein ACOX5P_00735 [Bacilli bacterium]|nr:hypothetical protein [Bacilli bacterium]
MLFLSVCNLKTNKLNRFEAMKKLGEEVAETYISLGVDSLQYAMMHRNEVILTGTDWPKPLSTGSRLRQKPLT